MSINNLIDLFYKGSIFVNSLNVEEPVKNIIMYERFEKIIPYVIIGGLITSSILFYYFIKGAHSINHEEDKNILETKNGFKSE